MEPNRLLAIKMKLRGLSYSQIAQFLDISRGHAVRLCRPPRSAREAIYIRARWRDEPKGELKCEFCQRSVGIGQIHHLLTGGKGGYYRNRTEAAVGDFNKLENLIFLCVGCHIQFHTKRFNSSDAARECIEKIRRKP